MVHKTTAKCRFRLISLLVAFSISMGFFESAVVIYLRELYYPQGFIFPIRQIPLHIGAVELFRELASLLMLLSVALITGSNNIRRMAAFLLSFATWDLTYYIFLKIFLDWPSSILDWDILFLIPVPWLGPVLVPCLVSVSMIFFSAVLYTAPDVPLIKLIPFSSWLVLVAGSLLVILSCTFDYSLFLFKHPGTTGMISAGAEQSSSSVAYSPGSFPWLIFICGILLITLVMITTKRKANRMSMLMTQ